MHKFTKKRITIGALGVLAVVGIAVAYFTTTGSGDGDAKVGTSEALTISAVSASELYPGTSSQVTFKVTNPSTGHQFVTKVKLKEVKAYEDEAHEDLIVGCKDEWFSMAEVTENQDVPTGETTLTNKGSLEFLNKPESQNACKNAYLVASFESN
jgi:hypothetical protein